MKIVLVENVPISSKITYCKHLTDVMATHNETQTKQQRCKASSILKVLGAKNLIRLFTEANEAT